MPKFQIFFILLVFSTIASAQKKLPTVRVETATGHWQLLTELTSNEGFTIISFWATWCKPCLKELDAFKATLAAHPTTAPVRLLAVSVDDSRTKARVPLIVKSKQWPITLLYDTNGDVQRALQVLAVPHTFIVNSKNEIIYQHTSFVLGDEQVYFEKMKQQ